MDPHIKPTYLAALRYLTRRNHTSAELTKKLLAKGHSPEAIKTSIDYLKDLHLMNDLATLTLDVQQQCARGFGPNRIKTKLAQRGLAVDDINEALEQQADNWLKNALDLLAKKFKGRVPIDYQSRQKQARFLYYRGFTSAQIQAVFAELSLEDNIEIA